MIKAVLFDMDGVLIEAKDWHYDALNRALLHFGMAIDLDAHLATFDGLPTKTKLHILTKSRGLPVQLHGLINEMKQKYTMELINIRCKPMFHHQFLLSSLKQQGMKIAVCSNSIGATVNSMMRLAGLDEFLDLKLSAEDVHAPKPDPAIYLKAMEVLGMEPHECVIVEDNDHGLQAARASGGHVLQVVSTADVNMSRLSQFMNDLSGELR